MPDVGFHIEATSQYRWGSAIEERVVSWMRARGYTILPACLMTKTGAPLLLHADSASKDASPDLFVFSPPQQARRPLPDGPCWVEIKGKSQPLLWRETRTYWHGIEWHVDRRYRRVATATRHPVELAVYEYDSKKLLWLRDYLSLQPTELGPGMPGRGGYVRMANYPRDRFVEVTEFAIDFDSHGQQTLPGIHP